MRNNFSCWRIYQVESLFLDCYQPGGNLMNRFELAAWLMIIAALASAGLVRAQTQLGPKDSTKLPAADLGRIKVGDEAPDFTLEDQDGKPVTLSGYRGKKSVALIFYRGHW
jgi:cytochrome oxidase Cu insertion factor (SCO1/SenC/PrrC family)